MCQKIIAVVLYLLFICFGLFLNCIVITRKGSTTMKFRAVCKDATHMRELVYIVTAISRISRDAACILQHNRIIFIVSENVANGIPLTWADIGTGDYFPEYQMEGISSTAVNTSSKQLQPKGGNDNQIVLTINVAKLVLAMSALSRFQSPYLKLKLTDDQFPCLSVSMEHTGSRALEHSVPVTVVPVRDWSDFGLPRLPADLSTVAITMPGLRQLRTLVDNFRKMSPSMTVYCSRAQALTMVSETDMATVACHYRTVAVEWSSARRRPVIEDDDDDDGAAVPRGDEDVACRIATKQMATFLGSIQGGCGTMTCNISLDRMVKLSFKIRDRVTLNCLFPEVCL